MMYRLGGATGSFTVVVRATIIVLRPDEIVLLHAENEVLILYCEYSLSTRQ